jgi:hypothetical protein
MDYTWGIHAVLYHHAEIRLQKAVTPSAPTTLQSMMNVLSELV